MTARQNEASSGDGIATGRWKRATNATIVDARKPLQQRPKLTPLLTCSPAVYVTGCVTSALLLQRSKAQCAPTQLDDTTGDANAPIGCDLESQPAAPSDRLALVDRQLLWQRGPGNQ